MSSFFIEANCPTRTWVSDLTLQQFDQLFDEPGISPRLYRANVFNPIVGVQCPTSQFLFVPQNIKFFVPN
jgi:hypothetical protein